MVTPTDTALNVNRFEQSVCGHGTTRLLTNSRAAYNIKLKRNLKKKGFIGYRKCVQVMKCLQVQKNANYFAANNLSICSHFFAGTVVLSIPSFLNFVKPLFVICNPIGTLQT